MSGAMQVFEQYLNAFTSGDIGAAEELVAEDFSFNGPMLQADSKEAFFTGRQV